MEILAFSVVSLIVSIVSLVLSVRAYSKAKQVEQELKDNYWNKGVVGRTISSKVGIDVMTMSEEQDKALKLSNE
jgi:hypothetical protein